MELQEQIEEVLSEVRPHLQADGGDVELVEVQDDGVVKVRLLGHCGGCPFAMLTLKNGIEMRLKRRIPQVTEVQAVE
jgi:Fe-S cluster biogenesis protein NfuA